MIYTKVMYFGKNMERVSKMTRLNDIAEDFILIFPYFTNEQICKHFKICSNTLWRWKTKLKLLDKPIGRKTQKVKFKNNNYGISLGDNVIYMDDEKITSGRVIGFNEDKAILLKDTKKYEVYSSKCVVVD